jgi:hypothetical protein
MMREMKIKMKKLGPKGKDLPKIVMALDDGPEAHLGQRSPLGVDPLLSPNKIRFKV